MTGSDTPTLPPHPRYPEALNEALWLMPDKDLHATINRLATTQQAHGRAIAYYLDEWDYRERRKLNRLLLRLTKWLTVLAAATFIVAALNVVLLFR